MPLGTRRLEFASKGFAGEIPLSGRDGVFPLTRSSRGGSSFLVCPKKDAKNASKGTTPPWQSPFPLSTVDANRNRRLRGSPPPPAADRNYSIANARIAALAGCSPKTFSTACRAIHEDSPQTAPQARGTAAAQRPDPQLVGARCVSAGRPTRGRSALENWSLLCKPLQAAPKNRVCPRAGGNPVQKRFTLLNDFLPQQSRADHLTEKPCWTRLGRAAAGAPAGRAILRIA